MGWVCLAVAAVAGAVIVRVVVREWREIDRQNKRALENVIAGPWRHG